MTTTVTLMVQPAANERNNPPQFLVEEQIGQSNSIRAEVLWRDLGFSEVLTKQSPADIRAAIDKALREMRESLDDGEEVRDAMFHFEQMMYMKFFDPLIPTSVEEILAQALDQALTNEEVPILRIHVSSEYDWIPWEIMHDRTDFLGTRFQIARLPIVPTIPDLSNNDPHQVEHIVNVLGHLGHGVLDDTLLKTWVTTFSDLVSKAENVNVTSIPLDPLIGPWPKSKVLQSSLESDILHFTCHGGIEQDEETYWVLDYDKPNLMVNRIGVENVELTDLSSKHPLVFGNACSSAAGGAAASPHRGLAGGFGPTFFASGARAFVGTFTLINTQIAFEFPRHFYRRLLGEEKLTIAEALRATKEWYQGQGDADPSWLFYCLYGPPEASFVLASPPDNA
jgi:CHAT domain-containing protein